MSLEDICNQFGANYELVHAIFVAHCVLIGCCFVLFLIGFYVFKTIKLTLNYFKKYKSNNK